MDWTRAFMIKPNNMLELLEEIYGNRIRKDVLLSNYTASRVGGKADALIVIESAQEMSDILRTVWDKNIPYVLIGGGSNILVSDLGFRGLAIVNRAKTVRFDVESTKPTVWVESGASLSTISQQAANRGLSGLEWAAGIPGTVGGAVFGNAGAHGREVADVLTLAEILHRDGTQEAWTVDRFRYRYRSSLLKRHPGKSYILSATFGLTKSNPESVKKTIERFTRYRRKTQPLGASMGSMFKNPVGDYAGRLIEAAGLKGTVVGGAMISDLHANFFVNRGNATAMDIHQLIKLARIRVEEMFGVRLELEIEYIGDWKNILDFEG